MEIEKIPHTNIILIGMPAVGKSTLGVLLAKRIGFGFIDTDLLIQTGEGMSLKRIIHDQGVEAFCDLEAKHIERLYAVDTVIATGGSVVYRPPAMQHLAKLGRIVFLDIDLAPLTERLNQLDQRGVVRKPGQTIGQIYAERRPLYQQYAQITVDCSHFLPDKAVREVQAAIQQTEINFSPPERLE